MTDLDLERLGDMWRQQPDPAELAELRRAADVVRRRARWAQVADLVAAVAVAGVVLLLVLTNPKVDTFLAGGAAILVLLFGQHRQRRLRREELRGLAGSTQEMLDQSIARVEATMKRTRFQLIGMAPSFMLGLAIAALVDRRSGGGFLSRIVAEPQGGLVLAAGALVALVAALIYFGRSARRGRAELARLRAMRDAYRTEQEPIASD